MFNLLAETTPAATNWLLEILKLTVPAAIGVFGALFAILVWHHKKRTEPKYESLAYLNQKRLDGLLGVWSLLGYITLTENSKTVMLWERSDGQTMYYLRPRQAREYMMRLSELFYDTGYGLLLGREIKELLYEYRGLLYGVLLKAAKQQADDNHIKLENEELVRRMKEIYNELNTELKQEREKMGK